MSPGPGPGLVLFIASIALGAACAVISCRRTSRRYGKAAATREAAVLGTSLGVYMGLNLAFGFGFWPQTLGCLLGTAVVVAGRRWVPSLAEHFTKGDD